MNSRLCVERHSPNHLIGRLNSVAVVDGRCWLRYRSQPFILGTVLFGLNAIGRRKMTAVERAAFYRSSGDRTPPTNAPARPPHVKREVVGQASRRTPCWYGGRFPPSPRRCRLRPRLSARRVSLSIWFNLRLSTTFFLFDRHKYQLHLPLHTRPLNALIRDSNENQRASFFSWRAFCYHEDLKQFT